MKKKLYRARNGKIFGLCQGLADWKDLPVQYIRLFLVIAFIMSGFFPVGALYFIAAFFIPKAPVGYEKGYQEGFGEGFHHGYKDRSTYEGHFEEEPRRGRKKSYKSKEAEWDKRFMEDE